MSTQLGIICFLKNGRRHYVPYPCQSRAQLLTLAQALDAKSHAKIDEVYFVEIDLVASSEQAGEEVEDIQVYAKMRFQDDEGEFEHRKLPAPNLNLFVLEENKGYRMPPDIGNEMAGIFGMACNTSLTFIEGWLDD